MGTTADGAGDTSKDLANRAVEQDLEARCRQQTAVAELGQRAAGADLCEVLSVAVTSVREVLGVEYSSVLELLPSGDELLLRAGEGWRDGLVGRTTVPANVDSQASRALSSSAPVMVKDMRTEAPVRSAPLLRDHGVVSDMSGIIGHPANPFGVLGAHTTSPRSFSDDDMSFLQACANVLGAAVDRDRQIRAIRAAEAEYRGLFEYSPVAIIRSAIDGTIQAANQAAARLLGYDSVDELITAVPNVTMFQADPAQAREFITQLRKNGGITDFGATLRRRDGTPVRVSANARALRDATGRITAVEGMALDVTEHTEAEERYRALSELVSDYAACLRVDDDSIQVEWITGNAERTFGYAPDELNANNGPFQVVASEDLSLAMAALTRVLEGEETDLELRVETRSGDLRWIRMCGRPIIDPESGRVLRILTAGRDITEKKREEQERRELLSRVMKAQDDEDVRIARELHDNLGQLLTSASLFAKTIEEEAAAEGRDQSGVKSLRAMIERALSETRTLVWSMRPTEVAELGLVPALRSLAMEMEARHRLHVDFHASLPNTSLPSQIETAAYRVVQEALTNAVKHADARSVSIVLARHASTLWAIVEDDGRGFDAISPAGPRLRAGLVGMRERAESIGGRLIIESSPGTGTTVRLEVPFQERQ